MRRLVYVFTALALVGCGAAEEQIELRPDFVEFSKSAALSWNDAWAAGDAVGIVDRYGQDIMLLAPNQEPIVGKAAAQAFWQGAMEVAPIGTITWMDAMTGGDLGVVRGEFHIYAADSTQIDHGKYIEVWQVVEGDWKMTRDIWNSSVPLPDSADPEM